METRRRSFICRICGHSSRPELRKVRIISERFHVEKGYTAAEEIVDMDSGMSAYMETVDGVKTTWLLDSKNNALYKYKPYSCVRNDVDSQEADLPNIIDIHKDNKISLYGISALVHITKMSPPVFGGRLDGQDHDNSKVVRQKWTTNFGRHSLDYYLDEITGDQDADPYTNTRLSSIEIRRDGEKIVIINILSIEWEIPTEVYQTELQLPLIYGCRGLGILSAEVIQRIKSIRDDRHYLKMRAKAINFNTKDVEPVEANTIEFAVSQPQKLKSRQHLIDAQMIRQKNSQKDRKIVVDHHLGVKYEVDLMAGTCKMGSFATLNPRASGGDFISIEFADDLKLKLSRQNWETLLYSEIEAENFMKLEQAESVKYAYFADTHTSIFGRNRLGRVVRKYAISEITSPTLESVTIWIMENSSGSLSVAQVYNLDIIESDSMTDEAKAAEAFDVSRECYLKNKEMEQNRDYAWFEIEYTSPQERYTTEMEPLKRQASQMKSAFYRLIGSELGLSYMRVPKMGLIFGETSFTLKLLMLDSLPLHLIYDRDDQLKLDGPLVKARRTVENLHECSEFCKEQQCTGMTLDRSTDSCAITTSRSDSIRRKLIKDERSTTYSIANVQKLARLPPEVTRLERQIQAIMLTDEKMEDFAGFCDLKSSAHSIKNVKGFADIKAKFKIEDRLVEFVPSKSLVVPAEKQSCPTEGRTCLSFLKKPAQWLNCLWDSESSFEPLLDSAPPGF